MADEPDRVGLVFDIGFYDEQRISWNTQMEKVVNPTFVEEVIDKAKKKEGKAKRIKSQYSNLEIADPKDLDQAIHQVRNILALASF